MNKRVGLLMVALIATLTSCAFSGKGNISKIYNEVKNKEVSFKGNEYSKVTVMDGSSADGKKKELLFMGRNSYYYFGISASIDITIAFRNNDDEYISIKYTANNDYDYETYNHSILSQYINTGKVNSCPGCDSDDLEYITDLLNDVNSYWTTTYGYGIR